MDTSHEQPAKRRKLASAADEEEAEHEESISADSDSSVEPSDEDSAEDATSNPPQPSNDPVTESVSEHRAPETTVEAPPLPDEPVPTDAAPPLPDEPVPTDVPPLPNEPIPSDAPPLPNEPVPAAADDGWEPVWDANAQAYYFYNRFTQVSQWENPRVPDASDAAAPPAEPQANAQVQTRIRPAAQGGYNPAIHGDYDPNADYALADNADDILGAIPAAEGATAAEGDKYGATAQFNRFTGRFQAPELNPAAFSDEAKARRQMGAYFDVENAADHYDGRSFKKERQSRRLTKNELKAFRERKKERKEEKRRAWLRD